MTPDDARTVITASLAGLADTAFAATSTIARHGPTSTTPALPRVSLVPSADTDLTIVRELARGGMGIVHLAEQRSLAREVAIKTARTHDAAIVSALVREARIMGALEHPSLVPVHALGIDPDGAPVLVMKRIEGVAWRTLLNDADHEAWKPLLAGHDDRLRAHVEILAQICRALAFAHDRGVVHRDLKPDNVMIGRFGEVYLLDWGVALRLSEAASEPHGIVGTPAYLAPEMARGEPKEVDARTDVYLLGAVLYEIVTGSLPHEAETPVAALVSALLGEMPPLPDDLAPELATLLEGAMAANKADRIASAEAFRVGLTQFLAGREADVLVKDARVAMDEGTRALDAEAASTLGFRRLVEARFALVSALRLRPTEARARRDLDACLVRLAERDLALGSPQGARAYAMEASDAPAALLARIDAAEKTIAGDREAKAQRDTSPLARALLAAMGLLLVLYVGWAAAIRGFQESPIEPVSSLVVILILSVPLGVLAVVMRRRLFATEGTRRLLAFFVLWYAAGPAYLVLGIWRGQSDLDVPPMMLGLSFFVALGTLSLLTELWPTVILHFVATAIITAWPGHVFAVLGPFFILNAMFIVRALWLRGRSPQATYL